jgi:hypothetical protein
MCVIKNDSNAHGILSPGACWNRIKRRHGGCWLVGVAKNPDLNGLQSSILVVGVRPYTSCLLRNPISGHFEIVVRL